MKKNFTLESTSGSARAGILHTRRGDVQTPFFMSVGTRGAIKAGVSMQDLIDIQAPVLLCNTYHMHLRPGEAIVKKIGGLHEFAQWDNPILTDSGGFQVYSLKRKKITDEGVKFRSHIDGEAIFIGPEESINIQCDLGADMIMVFDECPPNVPDFHKIRRAVDRTTDWAIRSKKQFETRYEPTLSPTERVQLFGIIQGGCFPELRQRSLEAITNIGFDGYALGGLAVGESSEEMYKVLDEMVHQMPTEKPRYLMGVGTPANLLEAIERGIDMFDCVMPMRNARHGTVFTSKGTMKIRGAKYKYDETTLDPGTDSPIVKAGYSKAYLHHLMKVDEGLGKRLLTIHNLWFYHDLMRQAREHIVAGDFNIWKEQKLKEWGEKQLSE